MKNKDERVKRGARMSEYCDGWNKNQNDEMEHMLGTIKSINEER